MTTNRLKTIDPAIKSRINLLLAYQELDGKMRTEVWKSLVKKSNIDLNEDTIQDISHYKINGREIRNYLNLVVSIHKENNNVITNKSFCEVLKDCFDITDEFSEQVNHHIYS